MRFLANLYPGDAVVSLLVVVIAAVMIVSAVAGVVALLLERRPAVRHCVLLSALVAVLVTPLLALTSSASRATLVKLPLLPRAEATLVASGERAEETRPVAARPLTKPEHAAPAEDGAADKAAQTSASLPSAEPARVASEPLEPFAAPIDVFRSAVGAVLVAWLCGTFACASGLLLGGWRLRRLRRSLQPVGDAELGGAIDAARRLLGVDVAPAVMSSPLARTPLAAGWLRPVIILPAELPTAISHEQLCDVLLHEMAHVARRDNLVVMLQAIAKAIYWPFVSVHGLNRQLAQAREEVCDNHVLARRDALSYGETLLRLAQLARGAAAPLGAVGILHWRGKLEQRVLGLLQVHRSTLTRPPRALAVAVVAAFLATSAALSATTILSAPSTDPGKGASQTEAAETKAATTPTTPSNATAADPTNPKFAGRFSGRVLGPDRQPLARARIFIVPINSAKGIAGPQRAETDADGRFEFDAPDMTYTESDGLPARRQGLLIATATGYAADWVNTWGQKNDTGLRSHWDPVKGAELELQLATDDTPIHGRFLDADDRPLAGARVQLAEIMVPKERDLDAYLEQESKKSTFESSPEFERSLQRLGLIPGLKIETRTDADGRFTLAGIGRDRLAHLTVTAPSVLDTTLTVMTRDAADFRIQPPDQLGVVPVRLIHGAGFTLKLAHGRTTTGRVIDLVTREPIAGMWVGPRGETPLDGLLSGEFSRTTDADGRFTITGQLPLGQNDGWQDIVAVSAPGKTYQTTTAEVKEGQDVVIECPRGIPFRLKLVDEQGKPVEAEVTYIDIQPNPFVSDTRFSMVGRKSQRYYDARWPIGRAQQLADGSYAGFVLPGPGAVLVKTKRNANYRSAHVDPKKFFAPEKTDWTPQQQITEYGTHDTLSTFGYWWLDQHDYAAIVLVNPAPDSKPLELSATLMRDRPRQVSLVDSDGQGVVGVQTEGLTFHPYDTELPLRAATFPLTGLHPDRVQRIVFVRKDRQLIGSLVARGDSDAPIVVRMQPWGIITGRIVDENGQGVAGSLAMGEYGLVIDQETDAVLHGAGKTDDEGRFSIGEFVPGKPYSGKIYRGNGGWNWEFAGTAFENLTLQPGEVRQLGDLRAEPNATAKTAKKPGE